MTMIMKQARLDSMESCDFEWLREPTGADPASMARDLVQFWYERWPAEERLSDVPIEPESLTPWRDYLAGFEVLDHGDDFRADWFGAKLAELFGHDWSGARLSEMPSPHRQQMRQVLLRAAMIREPVAEQFDLLEQEYAFSCITCALPVAGGYFQPSRLLLGIFWRASMPAWIEYHGCPGPSSGCAHH